jgi:hypothetical protein
MLDKFKPEFEIYYTNICNKYKDSDTFIYNVFKTLNSNNVFGTILYNYLKLTTYKRENSHKTNQKNLTEFVSDISRDMLRKYLNIQYNNYITDYHQLNKRDLDKLKFNLPKNKLTFSN